MYKEFRLLKGSCYVGDQQSYKACPWRADQVALNGY